MEMEESITVEELNLLVDASRKQEHREHKFMAALKGIDLDEGKPEEDFERIKQKAEADLAGKTEEEFVFDMIGIDIETEDNN